MIPTIDRAGFEPTCRTSRSPICSNLQYINTVFDASPGSDGEKIQMPQIMPNKAVLFHFSLKIPNVTHNEIIDVDDELLMTPVATEPSLQTVTPMEIEEETKLTKKCLKSDEIRCFRHNDGKPFELQKENNSTALVCTDLEEIVNRRVMRRLKRPKNGDSTMQQQAFLCPRHDVAYLRCSGMPTDYSIRTIFGIPEDNQYPRIEMVYYQAMQCRQEGWQGIKHDDDHKSKTEQRTRQAEAAQQPPASREVSFCSGPHSDWKRAQFKAVNRSVLDKSARNKRTVVSWIDLRKFQTECYTIGGGSFLSTEAGVVHFLRSVLTPFHDASPWNAAADPANSWEREEKYDTKDVCLRSSDIVVLVLNFGSSHSYENDFSMLKKFRVSDAAPSWFLHGFAHLEDLERSPSEMFSRNVNRESMESTSTSTLLIYKKLSSRQILHTVNPALSSSNKDDLDLSCNHTDTETVDECKITHETIAKGCLWEEYEVKESGDSDIPKDAEETSCKKSRQYRLVSPPYLNLDEEYPGRNLVAKLFSKEALRIFTEDALSVPQWTPWPETAHYKVSSFGNEKPWTVFPLCHCFPADKPDNFTWVPATKSFVPRTCRLLEEACRYGDGQSYLRTALFSQLAPRSVLQEHTGWADLANHVLRLHIPIVVPRCSDAFGNHDDLCGTWVDGCVETHAVGRPLLFDDSKTHRAFNYSDADRIILIVDLARPEKLPLGTAESGHTEELDSFIQQMSVPK